jgi:hypothetical protein
MYGDSNTNDTRLSRLVYYCQFLSPILINTEFADISTRYIVLLQAEEKEGKMSPFKSLLS